MNRRRLTLVLVAAALSLAPLLADLHAHEGDAHGSVGAACELCAGKGAVEAPLACHATAPLAVATTALQSTPVGAPLRVADPVRGVAGPRAPPVG